MVHNLAQQFTLIPLEEHPTPVFKTFEKCLTIFLGEHFFQAGRIVRGGGKPYGFARGPDLSVKYKCIISKNFCDCY